MRINTVSGLGYYHVLCSYLDFTRLLALHYSSEETILLFLLFQKVQTIRATS